MSFVVVIPARYASSRLPGKPLADIDGKPMIQWVVERAKSSGAERVIVATDDERIEKVVKGFGGEACMTAITHKSGTERLAEVCEQYQFSDEQIIVNVQGDEPLLPPELIKLVADSLETRPDRSMATLACPIHDAEELFNPNAVKVVTDADQRALYFSRATIPWDREKFGQTPPEFANVCLRHIGLYAYRAGFIARYVSWPVSPLEQIEALEQLRVLWHGESIQVEVVVEPPPAGIDTPEDLARAKALLSR
ncbi:3-deoxy-manno-octulosonate cytidylyltransferase [Dongshaea marina]|uniref:3-deoxy-manno-octulosonate cytidylyltransferase n=1 Tax=Dongshaea marina TaxID=2047966 RepID=UPI000D3EA54A|nr:3-deoxy-manno-octulosonate cytidylyltransferase [Dongshaea marina]